MNNSDPTAKYIIIGWFSILAIFVFLFSTGILYVKKDPIEPIKTQSWNDTWCLQDVIPANGGTIAEPTAGNYQYTLIARSNGTVEVWKECE
jgi:hypothetical protein